MCTIRGTDTSNWRIGAELLNMILTIENPRASNMMIATHKKPIVDC
jgi:hypothetical protein